MHMCGLDSRTFLRVRDVCGLHFERGRPGCFIICDSSLPIPISGLLWDIPFCSFLMTQLTPGPGGAQHGKVKKWAKKSLGMKWGWKGTDLARCWRLSPKEAFKERKAATLGDIHNAYANLCLQQGWKGQAKLHTICSQLLKVSRMFPMSLCRATAPNLP